MAFQRLPPELLLCVLSEVDNADDLVATITASAACFRAFDSCPKQIIKSVLTNAMHPEALQCALALAAFTSSKNSKPDGDSTPAENNEPAPPAAGSSKVQQFGFSDDNDVLLSMLRMHRRVSFLVRDYASRAVQSIRDELRNSFPSPQDMVAQVYWAPLSPTEQMRFERAFYRYELYCQVNPSRRSQKYDDYCKPSWRSVFDMYGLFLYVDQPWNEEEMECVHGYLCERVQSCIRNLNLRLVEDVLASPGVEAVPDIQAVSMDVDRNTRLTAWRKYMNPVYVHKHRIDHLLHWSSYSWYWKHERHRGVGFANAEFVACGGLKFMTRMVTADDTERKIMLPPGINIRSFASEITTWTRSRSMVPANNNPTLGDCPLSGTFGFRTVRPSHIWLRLDHSDPVRNTAYLFWDVDRVRLPWVNKALSTAALVDNEEAEKRDRASWGESAARRLRGVILPRPECERIEREYGKITI